MIRATIMIVLTALAFGPAAAQEQVPAQRVLVLAAHPDDELFMAPAIAALARQGAEVTIFYATSGDAGPGVSDLAPGAELAQTRIGEAWCAVEALGVHSLIPLGLGDGRLGIDARTPGSPANALREWLGRHLLDADVVMTWGPDGGYGHVDHRMVSALATQIVQAMPASTRPELLYVGIPMGTLPPVPELADWAETDPALLTQTIAYTRADLDAATAAAQCHVTQFDETTRSAMMPLFDATIWRGVVHFRPAF